MKAHQRIVRDRIAATGDDRGLFGDWWEDLDLSPANAVVMEVNNVTAKHIIEKYEWMGCMSAVTWHCYGIYFDGNCAGVVCYGPEYSENLGKQAREQGRKCADWSKYGFEGCMILLNRGACVHWAPPYAASHLIRKSMSMLPEKYEVITATTDPLAGEVGTVYQAAGFYFVGSMRDSNANVSSKKLDRDAWVWNRKLYGSRTVRSMCGSTKTSDIETHMPGAERVKQESKRRYFAFRGSRGKQKAHKRAIGHLLKDYPKRDRAQERATGDQSGGAGQCRDLAPIHCDNA